MPTEAHHIFPASFTQVAIAAIKERLNAKRSEHEALGREIEEMERGIEALVRLSEPIVSDDLDDPVDDPLALEGPVTVSDRPRYQGLSIRERLVRLLYARNNKPIGGTEAFHELQKRLKDWPGSLSKASVAPELIRADHLFERVPESVGQYRLRSFDPNADPALVAAKRKPRDAYDHLVNGEPPR